MGDRPASYYTHLTCGICGKEHDGHVVQGLSTCHQRPLVAHYDTESAREEAGSLFGRAPSLWRYAPMLPPVAEPVTLGEGWTPILSADAWSEKWGVRVSVKDEGKNPTGSFKARGMALAVSRAKHLGIERLSVPTAGNAGGALAAYAARAQIPATVAMPVDAPEANKAEVRAHGAELIEVDGLITDCGALLKERAATTGAFDVSTLKEPYRLEGKKTMGYELWEQLGELPDVIVYPTGGGTGLIGMWRAFDELEALGLIGSERPRMVTVQAEGCAPMVRAFSEGTEHAAPWEGASTCAGGLRVPAAVGDFLILEALRKSGGTAVTVGEDQIVPAMHRYAKELGLLVGPEAATTLPALERLVEEGKFEKGDHVVLFGTGGGLKHLEMFD